MIVANFITHVCPQQYLPFKMMFLLNVNLTLFLRRVSNSLSLNLGRLVTTAGFWLLELGHKRWYSSYLVLLGHSLFWDPAIMKWGSPNRFMERTTWMSSMTAQLQSQLRASINHQTCEQMRLWLIVVSSNTFLRSLQNFLAEAWDTMEQRKQLCPFWIPDPQNLWL